MGHTMKAEKAERVERIITSLMEKEKLPHRWSGSYARKVLLLDAEHVGLAGHRTRGRAHHDRAVVMARLDREPTLLAAHRHRLAWHAQEVDAVHLAVGNRVGVLDREPNSLDHEQVLFARRFQRLCKREGRTTAVDDAVLAVDPVHRRPRASLFELLGPVCRDRVVHARLLHDLL